MTEQATPIDGSRAHSARVYDYFLGGRTNFAADRHAAHALLEHAPNTATSARANRAFMHRATRHLARAGIGQFLDLGSGIPTSPNLHEIAQQVRSDARVVYVDNDPIVLAHAEPLLTGTPDGRTSYAGADAIADPGLLDLPAVVDVLDLDQPVALSLLALLHFVPDQRAHDTVRALISRLAPGSCLVVSHLTADHAPELVHDSARRYSSSITALVPRDLAEFATFFDGLEMVDAGPHEVRPGIASAARWRPDDGDVLPPDSHLNSWVGVGRIP
ncbi:SAM-dependent methyltransferase [Streptomyces sp. XM4193]|uniref:SAM-dependent methyltransferase n=1 Tax=Streptomyces sp. XM4193 TaxID=2929782 RepID=UPI001FFA9219|nr:SAM-dependent methyltransferase [Streptomyces sp. XM4193]MCK1794683.1 SAM-dependent methyltransferase [Streptomyces sp. XM4193]